MSEAFNELLTTYKIIGESLPLLEKCEGLLDGNPCVQQALESMFHDILEFHRTALTYFRKPSELIPSMNPQLQIIDVVKCGNSYFRPPGLLTR